MGRGFLDEDDFAIIGGGDILGESFDPVQKSIEFIERIETIQSEVTLLQNDIKEVWNEARDYGLDLAVLREVMRRRKRSKSELEQHDIAVGSIELRLDGEYDHVEDG